MVPEGFQHIIGLGNFPSEWTVKPADELMAKVTKGTTPPKSEIVENSNIPFLRVNNLSFTGVLNTSTEILYVAKNTHEGFLARSIAYPNDILMNIVGPPLGKIAMLDSQYEEYNMNQAIVIYRCNSDYIDKVYFLKFLSSELAQQWLQSRSKKTSGQQNLTIQLCKELPIPLPPLPEQKKIAQILSTWDKAISTTQALTENSQQQKKALMQQLLTGKKRFPGFEGEFQRYSFSDLVEIDNSSLGSKTPKDYKFTYISLSDVEPGVILDKLESHVFESAPSRAKRIVKQGDILLSTVRPNLKGFAKVTEQNDGNIASTGFSVLTPKSGVSGDYIYHYLFSCHLTGQINSLVVGSNYPAINSSDVKGLKIYCPDYDEQLKVSKVLNNCDEKIVQLKNNHELLKQEKKALMQQILTGKRRVKFNTLSEATC